MGTNFYLRRRSNDERNEIIARMHACIDSRDFYRVQRLIERFREANLGIHIGKRSLGWRFLFDVHDKDNVRDIASMRAYIASYMNDDYEIVDEYNDEHYDDVDVFLTNVVDVSMVRNDDNTFKYYDDAMYYASHENEKSWFDDSEHVDARGYRFETQHDFS